MKRQQISIFMALFFLGACSNGGPGFSTQQGNGNSDASASEFEAPVTYSPSALVPGDYKRTITIGDDERFYILHIPPQYDGTKPLPLVYILHGFGGSAASMIKVTGMSGKADHEGFIVAYLEGTKTVIGKAGWNSNLMGENVLTTDDVSFVRNLTKVLVEHVKVDPKKIYAAGFSNGAFMTHRLGAELTDLLAGIAVVEGTVGTSTDNGATYKMIPQPYGPLPIAIIHGKQDDHVLYYGGEGVNDAFISRAVSVAVEFWTTADGCTGTPQQQTIANGNVLIDDYTQCEKNSEVELFSVGNGRHEWPTLEGHTGFSATDAIWDFFSRHSKSE